MNLFPSQGAYLDKTYPAEGLTLLGAKTTCEDRWRQVLSEGKCIRGKHLVTLEGAISTRQTDDMRQKQLQLVVPKPIQGSYTTAQRDWLWTVDRFFEHVTEKERIYPVRCNQAGSCVK